MYFCRCLNSYIVFPSSILHMLHGQYFASTNPSVVPRLYDIYSRILDLINGAYDDNHLLHEGIKSLIYEIDRDNFIWTSWYLQFQIGYKEKIYWPERMVKWTDLYVISEQRRQSNHAFCNNTSQPRDTNEKRSPMALYSLDLPEPLGEPFFQQLIVPFAYRKNGKSLSYHNMLQKPPKQLMQRVLWALCM